MTRDPEALTRRRWDLLVVGGGIHGLFAAYDAAQRGLAVALIEADDFGSGLSFNHQRTLHGGLRALQTGHIAKVRQQIGERRTWARIAPHHVRPLPFLIATYGHGRRSRAIVRAGFRLYDLIGRRRNEGVSAELHLPRTRVESAAAVRKLFPGVAEKALTGGAVWYDYQTGQPDRLTWLVAQAAADAGATPASYTRASEPLRTGGHIAGVRAVDALSDTFLDIESTAVLLAAGSGLAELHRTFGLPDPPPLLRAMNVLLDRPARDIALAAPAASGRMLTAVPWRGAALVGTHQSVEIVATGEVRPSDAELDAFLDDIRSAFPALAASRDAVRLVHYGLVPALVKNGRADLLPDPILVSHDQSGAAGVMSVVGVKYTTARLAAEQAIDRMCARLGRSDVACRTAVTPLPSGSVADVEGLLIETERRLAIALPPAVAAHLASWYGTEAPAVVAHAADVRALEAVPDAPMLAGEISYAIRNASAVRLGDVVFRRTPLGSAGHPGRQALERVAGIMARELGWTAARLGQELDLVEARYPAPLSARRTP